MGSEERRRRKEDERGGEEAGDGGEEEGERGGGEGGGGGGGGGREGERDSMGERESHFHPFPSEEKPAGSPESARTHTETQPTRN